MTNFKRSTLLVLVGASIGLAGCGPVATLANGPVPASADLGLAPGIVEMLGGKVLVDRTISATGKKKPAPQKPVKTKKEEQAARKAAKKASPKAVQGGGRVIISVEETEDDIDIHNLSKMGTAIVEVYRFVKGKKPSKASATLTVTPGEIESVQLPTLENEDLQLKIKPDAKGDDFVVIGFET